MYANSNNYFAQLHIIETYPQLIGYDTEVYEYFRTQYVISTSTIHFYYSCLTLYRTHLCGLDLNLSYPQTGGTFPTVHLISGEDPEITSTAPNEDIFEHNNVVDGKTDVGSFVSEVSLQYAKRIAKGESLNHPEKRKKRDAHLSGRANGAIDPWYGCFIWQEMVDYAVNFTYPWTSGTSSLLLRSVHAKKKFLEYHLGSGEFDVSPVSALIHSTVNCCVEL